MHDPPIMRSIFPIFFSSFYTPICSYNSSTLRYYTHKYANRSTHTIFTPRWTAGVNCWRIPSIEGTRCESVPSFENDSALCYRDCLSYILYIHLSINEIYDNVFFYKVELFYVPKQWEKEIIENRKVERELKMKFDYRRTMIKPMY